MKRLHFLSACILFFALLLAAHAAEGDYIVYLRQDDPALLSAKSGSDAYIVVDADTLASLEAEGRVLYYEEDAELFLLGTVGFSDPYYAQKWDLTLIDAQGAWNAGYMGDGIIIGVIDSGVQADHPDLAANLLPAVSFLDGISADVDTVGHGTFVTGMLAAAGNGIGTVGVAQKAKIKPMKCFENGVKTTVSMTVPAIYKAVDDYGCKILNLSFGSTEDSKTLHDAVQYAIDKGCIVVAAVGNDGKTALNYPATYPGVIGVGSVNARKAVSSFSQKNESVKLVAPGEKVVSTFTGSRYGSGDGTSFATPLVSGAAALLCCADDSLSPQRMYCLLTGTATPLGAAAYSTSYGYGLLNIGGALRTLAGVPGDLDGDGAVTMRDVLLLLRAVVQTEDPLDMFIGDMNGDGTLSSADVLLLLRAAAAA